MMRGIYNLISDVRLTKGVQHWKSTTIWMGDITGHTAEETILHVGGNYN